MVIAKKIKKRSNALTGSAGVHYVCSILNANGIVALPTIRNTEGFDIVVLNRRGELGACIQVKTNSTNRNSWILGDTTPSWFGDKNYYVFVNYDVQSRQFKAFMEHSSVVIRQAIESERRRKIRGLKKWSAVWRLPPGKMPKPYLQWRLFAFTGELQNNTKKRNRAQ